MPNTVENLPLSRVLPHGKNPRTELAALDELTESIKAQGVLEPLIVAPLNGTQYTIIAGHRRREAAKKAGLLNVPCWIREDLDTPDKQLAAMLVENTQRVDLTPIEEADAYAQLVAFPGWNQAKAAKATGRDAKTVKARIAIAKLPDTARAKVASGQATLADATALAGYTGKPEYSRLEGYLGTANFGYEIERLRREKNAGALATAVRKYAKDHGWTITKDRGKAGRSILESYSVKAKTPDGLVKTLDELDGDHVLIDDGGTWWSVHEPRGATIAEAPKGESAWEKQRREAAEKQERLDTARAPRAAFLSGRFDKLVLKPAERVEVLRLLVDQEVELTITPGETWEAERLQTAGMPTAQHEQKGLIAGDQAALDTWIADANEQQLWKAYLCLRFAVGVERIGTDGHRDEVRLAMVLGYEPSDVERDLLAPAGEDA
jgi:ParB/RepB/Spo0J family partition protein